MLRPPWLDLLALLLPPALGVLLFMAAAQLRRLPRFVFAAILTLTVSVVAFLVTAYFSPLRDWTDAWLYPLGGERSLACGAGLLLLGVVWGQPGRSTSSSFLVVVVALVTLILLLDGSGRLWWRWLSPGVWNNRCDAAGCVRQTSSVTCGPAAAVMLLHAHGIEASEGELAYEAETSFFGTSLAALANVISKRAHSSGMSARVERLPFDTWAERQTPFLAQVQSSGGHALFVERLTDKEGHVIDPATGKRAVLPRAAFLRTWEGRGISLSQGP